MRRRGINVCGILCTIGLVGCNNTFGPDSVSSLEVEIDRTTLIEGENTRIGVSARDLDGGTISGSEVTWTSRDPTTVRVEDGSLFAVAPGVTRIVADVRGVRDSVRIRVRFADLQRGEIGVRMQSEGGTRQATSGYTFTQRILNLDGLPTQPRRTSISTRIGDQPVSSTGSIDPILAATDTIVWITFAGDPEVGARQLAPFEIDTLNGTLVLRGSEGAMVRVVDPTDPFRMELYAPVEPVDLEIDEVTFPEPGEASGYLRGSVAFEAAGVVLVHDTATHKITLVGPASESTLRVYAEFETDLFEALSGTARLDVTLDDVVSTGYTGTAANVVNNGTEFRLPIATIVDSSLNEFVLMHTRVEAIGPGTNAVNMIDPDVFDPKAGEAGSWSYATIQPSVEGALLEEDITRRGYSISGEVELTEYTAPTQTGYGLMRGTYSIVYTLTDQAGTPTGDTMTASAEFLLPITPVCGLGRICN